MEWYPAFGLGFMIFSYFIIICWGLYEFGRYAYSFIKRQKHIESKIISFISDNCFERLLAFSIVLVPILSVVLWPIIILIGIAIGILYGGRHLYERNKHV